MAGVLFVDELGILSVYKEGEECLQMRRLFCLPARQSVAIHSPRSTPRPAFSLQSPANSCAPTSHLTFNRQPTTPHTSPVPPSRSPRTPPHQSSLSETGATHILGLCLKLTPSASPAPNPHMQHPLLSPYIPPRSLSLPSLLARSRACLFCIEAFAYIIIQYIGLLFRVFRSFII